MTSGVLSIEPKVYFNPENKLEDGSCCDKYLYYCQVCDPYLTFIFGGKTVETPNQDNKNKTIYTSKDVIHFQFHRWQVTVYISVEYVYEILIKYLMGGGASGRGYFINDSH